MSDQPKTAGVRVSRTSCVWYTEIDGHWYKITRDEWDAKGKEWGGTKWRINGAQGIHTYARELDESRPTFKRVLGRFKEYLATED
jgi:hypothetical protein